MKKFFLNIAMLSMVVCPLAVSAKVIDKDLTLTEDLKESITVKSGSNVTLDLAGFNMTNTAKDHTITIEKGATLTIKGKGTATNTSDQKAVINNNGTVVINGGDYYRKDVKEKKENGKVITPRNTYYVVLNHGKMTINGGSFKIDDGISSLIDNGWYNPKDNTEKIMADLEINDGLFEVVNNDKYIKNDDFGLMTINGGTFNMYQPASAGIGSVGSASGKELVVVNGGTFNYTGTNVAIWDYVKNTVTINGGTFNLKNGKVTNAPMGVVNPGEENKDVPKEYTVIGNDGQKIIAKKSELNQKVEVKDVKENELTKAELELIQKAISNKYVMSKIYNIDLFNAYKDLKVEQITDTEKAVSVTLNIPTDLEKVKDGYSRKYYVVRVHDGKTDILDTTINKDGTLTFKTDKFSTYSLVYNDVENEKTNTQPAIENPKTGDNIITYVTLAGGSIIALTYLRKYLKKNN